MNFTFTTQDIIALCTLLVVSLGAVGGAWRSLMNRMDSKFAEAEISRDEQTEMFNKKLDEVKSTYARREDFVALTAAINILNGRIDMILSNMISKLPSHG